ncbi:MAG TPA: hypothetical protein VFG76_10165 [Candidatus Polarisedimenticolia bacterium]|jgi:hypothetical protein|nr:hypothetical protein [Candidatus Polarisedimenticolia bacterium]
MIPDRVVEVLHGPTWIQIGSRDEALRPAHTMAVGAVVHDDRQTVTVFVPTARSGRVLRDLTGNGRIAVSLALASHESYQLKGTYISSRPTDDTDRARQEARRAALLESALEAGYPETIARPLALGLAITPGVAITFRAEQVFLQTPGPGAGTLLS